MTNWTSTTLKKRHITLTMETTPRYFTTGFIYLIDKRKNDADPYMEGSSVKRNKENDIDKSNENNDLDSNIQKIRMLENVFNSQDHMVTNMLEEALDIEREVEAASPDTDYVSDSNPEFQDKTELYKYISKRVDERVQIAEEHSKSKENALNSEENNAENEIEGRLLDLRYMLSSTKHDLNTAKVLEDQLAGGDRDVAVEAVKTLKQLEQEQLALYVDIYGGDVPNIADHGTKPDKLIDDEDVSDTQSTSNQENDNTGPELTAENVYSRISDWVGNLNNYLPGGSDRSEENKDNSKSDSNEKGSEKGSLVDDFADVSSEPVDYMGGDD
jgi:hypothetical protein